MGSGTNLYFEDLTRFCQDVLMVRNIATESGFQDVARELLEGEDGANISEILHSQLVVWVGLGANLLFEDLSGSASFKVT